MKYGAAIFATDEGLHPAELGTLVEEAGFESLFVPEHTHIPSSRSSPAPRGGELPAEYRRTLDPFVTLTAVAGVTEKLRIGTGICLMVERDPITTAKEVASVDWVSGGRFLFGVGGGWNTEEMRNHGTDPDRRFALLKDRVRAMKEIWTGEEAAYHGKFVDFDEIWAWPKPIQKPHPPILIGGNGPTAENRVITYGDEWLPEAADDLPDRIAAFRERSQQERGEPLPVTVYSADPADVDKYEEAGAHRICFWLPPRRPEEIRDAVGELAVKLGLAKNAPC